ncbi:MAG: sigma-70 family RNA polymerase sigma factor [Elusimicrobia bacterium]|nr:sigma-70 family RNA polymerase sigma factor [Elusimicrobiota bacterium]
MENEEGLLKRIAGGEKEFFGELVLKHQDFIFNMVKGFVRFEEDARDITQEVFLKAYENIDKFRGDSKFSSWLYRIAYNHSINWSERKAGRETQLDDSFAETISEEPSTADEMFDRELVLSRIKEIIEELPVKYKIVLKLYYFKEKSYQEIADTLGIPINTVKIQLLRAKEQVRKKLDF